MGYSFWLAARVLLYASSHRQDNTYHRPLLHQSWEHWLEREIAQWNHHEGSIRQPIAPWANALTMELHLLSKSLVCLYLFSCLYPLKFTHAVLGTHLQTDIVTSVLTHCCYLLGVYLGTKTKSSHVYRRYLKEVVQSFSPVWANCWIYQTNENGCQIKS